MANTRHWFPLETRSALRLFGLCGLTGVLVDIDHIIAILLWKSFIPGITEGRIFHTSLFIVCCLAICYLGAYFARLYFKLVLVLLVTIAVLTLSPLVVWSW